jgi:protein TonB
MTGNPRQGFVLSLLLHVAVAAGVLAFTFIKPPTKPPRTVFELVAAPPPSAESSPDDDSVQFSMPAVRPPPPRPLPKPPVQEPPPVAQPVVPTPAPTPAPQRRPDPTPPPPPTISYEDYVRQHGPPRTQPARTQPPRPVTVPRINTTFTANIRETVINLDRLGELTDAEQSALDRWISRLKEALRRSWDKPTALAESLATVVEFDVASNGRFSNVRVTRGSGNRQFDDSVVGAFNRLGSAGATPDGRLQQLRLTFRMTDE